MGKPEFPKTDGWTELGVSSRNTYRVSERMVDMRRPFREVKTAELTALPQNLLFDLGRTAIIIVDMQNDFCHEDGWIAGLGVDTGQATALATPINRATEALRDKGVPVIWVTWGVRPDKLNLSPGTQHPFNPDGMGPGLSGELRGTLRTYNVLQKGSWGASLIDALQQREGDIHVNKHRISGFWDTPLDSILRNMGISTLLFAGVNADHCVLGTLMDANFHGYDTILLEDCTATSSPDFCLQATYHNVRFCFGFTATTDDLVKSLEAA